MAALGEVHHIIETAYAGRYTTGTVIAIPYTIAAFFSCVLSFANGAQRNQQAYKLGGGVAVSAA